MWLGFLNDLKQRELFPVVIFSFSRKMTAFAASSLLKHDMTTPEEKAQIESIVEGAFLRLKEEDRQLPQLNQVRELLSVGVGLHHAGLLPLVKEIVEICFSRGLLRCLFATETFAMGVNMPARCVCFNGLRKNDGTIFRFLLTSEYTQMSGRAGRRGIDTQGVAMIMCRGDEIPDENEVRQVLVGRPTLLESKFRLTYAMLVNLLRSEEFGVEQMIAKSFGEVRSLGLPQDHFFLLQLERKVATQEAIILESCKLCKRALLTAAILEYKDAWFSFRSAQIESFKKFMASAFSCSWLRGRVIKADLPALNLFNRIGIFVWVDKAKSIGSPNLFHALIECPINWEMPNNVNLIPGVFIGCCRAGKYVLAPVGPNEVLNFGNVTLKIFGKCAFVDRDPGYISHLIVTLREAFQKPDFLWDEHCKLKELELELSEAFTAVKVMDHALNNLPLRICSNFERHLFEINKLFYFKNSCTEFARKLNFKANDDLLEDYNKKQKVLIALGFINDDLVVQLKGKVACEVQTCESLILTEILFENILENLTAAEAAALLSCLIFQQKEVEPRLDLVPPLLHAACKNVVTIVKGLVVLQNTHGIVCDMEEWCDQQIKLGLVHVVHEWALGTSFARICQLTDVDEGTIVRCITRLEESFRDIRNCARVMGNDDLYSKMEEASELIKRDICFAASLYLS